MEVHSSKWPGNSLGQRIGEVKGRIVPSFLRGRVGPLADRTQFSEQHNRNKSGEC